WGSRGASDECGTGALRLQALPVAGAVLVQGLRIALGAHGRPPGGGSLAAGTPALRQAGLGAPPVEVAPPRALVPLRLRCEARQGGGQWASAPAGASYGACAGGVWLSAPAPGARLSRLRGR